MIAVAALILEDGRMLYLMRHAQTLSEVHGIETTDDRDLSTLGHNQAHKAGEWLADKGIVRIYTSPTPDAQQSAVIVGEALGITPEVHAELHEVETLSVSTSSQQAVKRFSELLMKIQNTNEVSLIVTQGELLAQAVPPLCVNAAALQRVRAPLNAGFIVLETFTLGRYICQSWDLRDHLSS